MEPVVGMNGEDWMGRREEIGKDGGEKLAMVMGRRGWLTDPALAAWEQRPEILTHMDVERSGTVRGIGLCLGRVSGWSPGWSCV